MNHIKLLNLFNLLNFVGKGDIQPYSNCSGQDVCDIDSCSIDVVRCHVDICYTLDRGAACIDADVCLTEDYDTCLSYDAGCHDDHCAYNHDYCSMKDFDGCREIDLHMPDYPCGGACNN